MESKVRKVSITQGFTLGVKGLIGSDYSSGCGSLQCRYILEQSFSILLGNLFGCHLEVLRQREVGEGIICSQGGQAIEGGDYRGEVEGKEILGHLRSNMVAL